ncbi:hypothetical protein F4679DRAFT_553730 [Xylaria curta]|nr:hypothetical protein F4679DRAFT_553730 [Xylaria curta]
MGEHHKDGRLYLDPGAQVSQPILPGIRCLRRLSDKIRFRAIWSENQHQKSGSSVFRRKFHQHLSKTGHFAALLSMDIMSSEPNDIVKARELIALAEAALTT